MRALRFRVSDEPRFTTWQEPRAVLSPRPSSAPPAEQRAELPPPRIPGWWDLRRVQRLGCLFLIPSCSVHAMCFCEQRDVVFFTPSWVAGMFCPLGSSWQRRRVRNLPAFHRSAQRAVHDFLVKGCWQPGQERVGGAERSSQRLGKEERAHVAQVKVVGWQPVWRSPAWPLAGGMAGGRDPFRVVCSGSSWSLMLFRFASLMGFLPRRCLQGGAVELESPGRVNLSPCPLRKTLRVPRQDAHSPQPSSRAAAAVVSWQSRSVVSGELATAQQASGKPGITGEPRTGTLGASRPPPS